MKKVGITICTLVLVVTLIGLWIKISITNLIEENVQKVTNFMSQQIDRIFSIKNILPF